MENGVTDPEHQKDEPVEENQEVFEVKTDQTELPDVEQNESDKKETFNNDQKESELSIEQTAVTIKDQEEQVDDSNVSKTEETLVVEDKEGSVTSNNDTVLSDEPQKDTKDEQSKEQVSNEEVLFLIYGLLE